MSAIIITGSRYLRDTTRLFNALAEHVMPGDIIVHGGAPGADTLAQQWADAADVATDVFKADWQHLGKAAGPRRNIAMLTAYHGCLLLAFPLGQSSGTRQCIAAARARKHQVIVFEMTDLERKLLKPRLGSPFI